MVLDGMLVFLSLPLGFWVRFLLPNAIATVPLRHYIYAALLLAPLHVLIFAFVGLYEPGRKKRLYQDLGRLLAANGLGFALFQMSLFLIRSVHFSRGALFFYFLFVNLFTGGKLIFVRKFLRRIRAQGYNKKRVVVIGNSSIARKYVDAVRASQQFGLQPVGYIADQGGWKDMEWLGRFGQIEEILDGLKPDEVVAALDKDDYDRMPEVIRSCEKTGVKLSLIPFYAQYMPSHPQVDSVNGLPLINLRRIPLDNLGNAFIKRAVDVAGSLSLILLTSPLMALTAVGVKLSSPGPVIFKQRRVGLNKREFSMYKFRSMRLNEASETGWTTDTDNRKTRFGAFIRKFSIDELPQLFNVLRGDMSLVGPRPEVPYYVEQFKEEIPLYMVKHQVRPGMTGWAQVNGLRGDTSIEERVRHDIYYIENWSLLLDVKILLMTLFAAVNKEKLP